MNELKPCPFCGEKVEFIEAVFTSRGLLPSEIRCPKCDYLIDGKVCYIGDDNERTITIVNNLLINWWNRRAKEKGKGK